MSIKFDDVWNFILKEINPFIVYAGCIGVIFVFFGFSKEKTEDNVTTCQKCQESDNISEEIISQKDENGNTPLHHAAFNNHIDFLDKVFNEYENQPDVIQKLYSACNNAGYDMATIAFKMQNHIFLAKIYSQSVRIDGNFQATFPSVVQGINNQNKLSLIDHMLKIIVPEESKVTSLKVSLDISWNDNTGYHKMIYNDDFGEKSFSQQYQLAISGDSDYSY
ncbi:MAG: hypothetical protein DGJ47_000602 [Rickettsiaceae bacterium]